MAIPLLERTLKAFEAKLGDDHPDTLTTRNNLAGAYCRGGKLDLAIPLFERTLKAREAKLGVDHPDTLGARNNLAFCYEDAGKLELAISLFESNLNATEVKLGQDHPNTFEFRNNLAHAYRAANKMEMALTLYEKLVFQARAKLGQADPLAIKYTRSWIQALEANQQYPKALTVWTELLPVQRKQLGADPSSLAGVLAQFGSTLLLGKKPADAEPILRECLAIRTKKEPDAWTTFNTQSTLGEALVRQGKHAEAEPQLLQGYQGMKQREAKIPAAGKVRLTEALERLVQLYDATGKKDEAAKWRRELEAARAAAKKP
jgi:tetratricopeptide (TPR) repeat protein